MEKDTVLLSLEKYNELRDFQKEVRNGKVFCISSPWALGGETTYFCTEDEVIKKFETRNKELEDKIKELENTINKYEYEGIRLMSMDDLKQLSYWEYRKLRKSCK